MTGATRPVMRRALRLVDRTFEHDERLRGAEQRPAHVGCEPRDPLKLARQRRATAAATLTRVHRGHAAGRGGRIAYRGWGHGHDQGDRHVHMDAHRAAERFRPKSGQGEAASPARITAMA